MVYFIPCTASYCFERFFFSSKSWNSRFLYELSQTLYVGNQLKKKKTQTLHGPTETCLRAANLWFLMYAFASLPRMVCIFLSWNKKWYWPVTPNKTPAAWFHHQTNLWRSASSVFSYLWHFLLPETRGTKRLTVVPNVSLTHWGNLSNLMEMSGVHNCVLALGSLDYNDRSHLGLLVVLSEAAEWTIANRRLGSREIPVGEANVVLIWSSPEPPQPGLQT